MDYIIIEFQELSANHRWALKIQILHANSNSLDSTSWKTRIDIELTTKMQILWVFKVAFGMPRGRGSNPSLVDSIPCGALDYGYLAQLI